jgi:hypothetical protein
VSFAQAGEPDDPAARGTPAAAVGAGAGAG